jgi:hypothetical protein
MLTIAVRPTGYIIRRLRLLFLRRFQPGEQLLEILPLAQRIQVRVLLHVGGVNVTEIMAWTGKIWQEKNAFRAAPAFDG